MVRLHDEQTNIVMVVVLSKRFVHHEEPIERGQETFRIRCGIRSESAFPFGNTVAQSLSDGFDGRCGRSLGSSVLV
jgi:hypothetical protein